MTLNKSNIDYVRDSGDLINRPGYTLNPVTGCKHGCEYCYARKMVCEGRLKGHPSYPYGFEPTFHPERIKKIGGKPKLIFLGNMGDVGGDWLWPSANQSPQEHFTIDPEGAASAMRRFALYNPDHIILLLTKRPEWYGLVEWPDNVWCGFSATNNEEMYDRYKVIREKVKIERCWMSLEPWMDREAPEIRTTAMWVVVGGLSKGSYSEDVSGRTLKWLIDPSIQARRFVKKNAIWQESANICIDGVIKDPMVHRADLPREYPDEWRVNK